MKKNRQIGVPRQILEGRIIPQDEQGEAQIYFYDIEMYFNQEKK